MIFKEPAMLLLLLALPLFGWLFKRARRLQNKSAEKLRGEKKRSSGWSQKDLLRIGSFAALMIALAQPAWNPKPEPLNIQGRDLVIALDISRSMLAADVFPTRLEAAKISIFETLGPLRGQRIGLITFAGAASVRVPLTLDHNFVRYMLERATPSDANVGSTSLQAAIEKALDSALSESKKGDQDIILFTDGEDHISDMEATAEQLRESGARVMIIGLGDPVDGANIPDSETPDEWMKNKDDEIVTTRLDEKILLQLSANSPNVIYHAAQTRPFDLFALYNQLIANTSALPVSDEKQIVYTEGYPLFIALSLLLWLLPLNKQLFPMLALLLITGCGLDLQPDEVSQQIKKTRAQWAEAQDAIETDPRTAVDTLEQTFYELLDAAMKYPGDPRIAQQIAGLNQQIHEVKKRVNAQQEAEKNLQKKLEDAIELLDELTQQQVGLSEKSRHLLRRRPSATPEEKAAGAPPALEDQTAIREGTGKVLETVTEIQVFIRKAMEAVYGKEQAAAPTEFDQAVNELTAARQSQKTAIGHLRSARANWVQANSAFLSAARQMQKAMQLLSDQNKRQNSGENSEPSDDFEMDWEFEEDMEWSESDMPSDLSMPMAAGEFQTDLQNRSLPTPNYTAEEILREEAANMKKRAAQKTKASGENVEKNW